jgi:F-type H+-transporting ATPase subunit delta
LTGNIVARRYAKALFALGVKEKAADKFGKDLEGLAGAMSAAPELLKLFKSPSFNTHEKKSVLKDVVAKLDMAPLSVNFLSVLADKGRLDCLPDIQKTYSELLDETSGVVRGKLTTAMELPGKRQKDIKTTLEKKSGKKLVLDFGVEPAILGGVVLRVGDKVLDASLRAQLQLLKEQIKRGE